MPKLNVRQMEIACAHAIALSRETGVALCDILGSRRHGKIPEVRQQLYKRLRLAGWSYPAIGEFFGCDHSTIVHGVNQADKRDLGLLTYLNADHCFPRSMLLTDEAATSVWRDARVLAPRKNQIIRKVFM